jgi:hypothetical protein
VRPLGEKSLTDTSVERLDAEWKKIDEAYGQKGSVVHLNLTDTVPGYLAKEGSARNVDDLIARTVEAISSVLEMK